MDIMSHARGLLLIIVVSMAWSADPFLKAVGPVMRNERGTGDVVPLRGVNLGAWLVLEHWMCPMDTSGLKDDWSVRELLTKRFGAETSERLINVYQDAWLQEADFDRIAAFGMNVVRLPFWYLNVQQKDLTWRPDAFKRLDWVVEQAWRRGMYTIIDLHGSSAAQRSKADTVGHIVDKATLWTDRVAQQQMIDLWVKVAERYAGNPAIAGYDLLNEPMDCPTKEAMWDLMDRCYRAIRQKDPDHTIIMEATFGKWNLDMLPKPASKKWENVAYQYHVYPWDSWNDVIKINADTEHCISDWKKREDWQVPAQVGEFNMAPEAAWKYAVDRYSASGMSWMMWAYKASFMNQQTTWGIYNPSSPHPRVPNLALDSADEIRAKWSEWTTDRFVINPQHRRALAMPVVVDDVYTAISGQELLTTAKSGVLHNDSHLNCEGVKMRTKLIKDVMHGFLFLANDGSFSYTPDANFMGTEQFRYQVWDGRVDSVRIATVTIRVSHNGGDFR